MNGSPKLPLLLGALFLMLAACGMAEACSCVGFPTTCQSYAGADAVFIGTVQKVEEVNLRTDEEGNVAGGQIARVSVEEVFKNMRQTELIFRSGNTSCDVVYQEGQRWLFYAYYDRQGKAWGVRACDRSTLIAGAADAADDLPYLRGLPGAARRTRLSGKLMQYDDGPQRSFRRLAPLGGVKVRIVGAQKTVEVSTNPDGVFEVYGLPHGAYAVEPDVPAGLKIRFPIYHGETDSTDEKAFKVLLKEKSCAEVSFVYGTDKRISWRLMDADRSLLPNVSLSLMPADKAVRGDCGGRCRPCASI